MNLSDSMIPFTSYHYRCLFATSINQPFASCNCGDPSGSLHGTSKILRDQRIWNLDIQILWYSNPLKLVRQWFSCHPWIKTIDIQLKLRWFETIFLVMIGEKQLVQHVLFSQILPACMLTILDQPRRQVGTHSWSVTHHRCQRNCCYICMNLPG